MAAVIVSVRLVLAVCAGLPESVTFTVSGVALTCVPAAGVPVMAPVELRLRPVGSVPLVICHEYGVVPPVAVSAAE